MWAKRRRPAGLIAWWLSLAVVVPIAGSLLFSGCKADHSRAGRETVDTIPYPVITVAPDGTITHQGHSISRDELVAFLQRQLKNGLEGGGDCGHDYGIIMIEAADEVPYGIVREIEDLIMRNGGTPGSKRRKREMEGGVR